MKENSLLQPLSLMFLSEDLNYQLIGDVRKVSFLTGKDYLPFEYSVITFDQTECI